jgi:CheY-like chemotaxis protein
MAQIAVADHSIDDFLLIKNSFDHIEHPPSFIHITNGKSLLEILSAKVTRFQLLPDLILLAMELPVVNGLAVAELICANDQFRSIPTIVYQHRTSSIRILQATHMHNQFTGQHNYTSSCEMAEDLIQFLALNTMPVEGNSHKI